MVESAVSGVSAGVEVSEVLSVSGGDVVLSAGSSVSAYSGESVSLSTAEMWISLNKWI